MIFQMITLNISNISVRLAALTLFTTTAAAAAAAASHKRKPGNGNGDGDDDDESGEDDEMGTNGGKSADGGEKKKVLHNFDSAVQFFLELVHDLFFIIEKHDRSPCFEIVDLNQKSKRAHKFRSMKQQQTIHIRGLPLDASKEELVQFARKCGMILEDPHTGQKKKLILVSSSIQCCFQLFVVAVRERPVSNSRLT